MSKLGTTKQTEKLVQEMWEEEKNLRKMAEIIIIDALASLQENEEAETVLHEVASVIRSGEDLIDTVPAMLAENDVSMESGISHLLPEMARFVKNVNKLWAGKVTVAELAKEFGDRVYTSFALQGVGCGVSPSDEPGLDEFLEKRGCKVPHDIYIDSGYVDDASWLVEDDLRQAIGLPPDSKS